MLDELTSAITELLLDCSTFPGSLDANKRASLGKLKTGQCPDTKSQTDVYSMLGQRRRRLASIKPTLIPSHEWVETKCKAIDRYWF